MEFPGNHAAAHLKTRTTRSVVSVGELNFLPGTVKSVVWRNCTRLRSGAHLLQAGVSREGARHACRTALGTFESGEQPPNEEFFEQENSGTRWWRGSLECGRRDRGNTFHVGEFGRRFFFFFNLISR